MNDLSLFLRRAIISHLKDDARLTALVGDQVYDDPSANAVIPFIRYGTPFAQSFEATGLDGSAHRVTLHVFGKGPSTKSAMDIASAVVKSMDEFDPRLINLIELQWISTNIIPDPDTRSAYHAIVQFQVTVAEDIPLATMSA